MKPSQKKPAQIQEEEKPLPKKSLVQVRPFLMTENGLLNFYPEYFHDCLTPNLQHFYQQNGHHDLIKSLKIEFVNQIEHCRQFWEEFSPQQTLFDTWEFRYAFWLGYRHKPCFILLKNTSQNLGLLPLWYEKDKQKYFWFGSWWQEENKFLVRDPILAPLLLAVCPTPVYLNAISLETVFWAKDYLDFQLDDPKYILNLTKINSIDDYLANLKKKKRYNLRRDRRIIEYQNPQVTFDNFSDFDTLVALSNKRFHEKGEDTDWEDFKRVKTFRQVINLGQEGKSYTVRMITVKIGKKIAGVDLIALYNDCYSPLKCGYDIQNFPGIGNFVNLLEIEDALQLGMKKMDFLEIGYGWKEKWFQAVPLFKYEKE